MDKPPGKHEKTNGGDDQKKPSKEPSVEADHQNPNSQKQHEGEAAEKPRDKKSLWRKVYVWFTPDKVQAGSAVIQAICAAALVILTVQLWLVTRDYKNYTGRQASAEATSASAAERAADAEATSAANETQALGDAEAQTRAEATNFNEQLGRLDSSIKAANNLASSAKRSADISKEALIASEAQFRLDARPYVQGTINGEHWDGNTDWIVVTVKNYGRTPAYRIVINYNIKAYLPPISGEEADLFKTIGDHSGWSGTDKFPGIEGGDSRAMSDPINFTTAAGPVAIKASQGTWGAGGFITYYDALGNKYVSDFCMTRDKSGATPSYCSGHNDPDVTPAKRPKRRH